MSRKLEGQEGAVGTAPSNTTEIIAQPRLPHYQIVLIADWLARLPMPGQKAHQEGGDKHQRRASRNTVR